MSVQRVIKTYGESFEKIAIEDSPMLAMAWLQPVVERYEQEGLKQDAEQLNYWLRRRASVSTMI